MVLQTMLENGFNGFPRASRSIRARGGLIGKKVDVKENRSFEILASVAGTLLDKSGKYSDTDDSDDHAHEGSYSEFVSDPMRFNRSSGSMDYDEKSETLDGKFEDEVNKNKSIIEEIEIVTGISGNQKTSLDAKPTETRCSSKVEVVSGNDDYSVEGSDMKEENRCVNTDGKIIDDVNNEMSQKIFPFKKRKLFNHQEFNRKEDAFDSHENRINGKACATSQQLTTNSQECNVKLSIKSFKVPELFIDISTNATVGSLKRTIMEAVTSILGDGLHVGILVQGKRVRDDTKTLIQTGISQEDKSHNLGFVLEPKHSRTSTAISTSFKNGPPILSRPRSHGLTRHLESRQGTSKHPQSKNLGGSHVESDLTSGGETLADMSSNKANPDSKSLVPIPKVSMKALALVHPLPRKSGHHEYGQRRIRRPFSVTEVEALVRAVEKLGTGRWRDVKFDAFDNAKHRTYVDLKDKWKTLVHTARISPQQRRGEPVPQELLERVLAAQAYWSHRQAKQHAMLTL